jgi:hypothetical protein
MKNTFKTNRPLLLAFDTAPECKIEIPAGAPCILVKDATYCMKQYKRIDCYAIANPAQYGANEQYSRHRYLFAPDDAIDGILADAVLIREPLKAKSDDWQETAHHWLITIGGQKFDYHTGIGHRRMGTSHFDDYRILKSRAIVSDTDLQRWLSCTIAEKPALDDVLHALVMDASACEESFDEWCQNFGYDTDSRKALDTYLQCQSNATKLRKAGVNIERERERLADY